VGICAGCVTKVGTADWRESERSRSESTWLSDPKLRSDKDDSPVVIVSVEAFELSSGDASDDLL